MWAENNTDNDFPPPFMWVENKKKRNTDHDFPPPFLSAENNKGKTPR